ncbi:MAG: 7-carboxy-7-deazaguanine synthase QueE [Chromatiaceae bacterium]|nr:7-carboxy-7-deazaguanine synthase QueE [Gammaproteobacteria bacterium]MCP5318989.1 7-carboxy-7-deazaguanine synthase QueE [Chromatiaceae bacterium]MCW5586230.1 7-carboxy-7-deazaguanine synthase QueE [Chromatiales bacterium]MCP5430344.1 7-carboxy-7-deazaguanine synthase QueE [Chromatiaceae bacterium]MCP5436323.1 7-carboxy-7-deazaguanine synthase QueE [Chromatiaceae bacterium]
MSRLRITEIFHSLQGESASVGWRTVFVRLTGCPLRCGYCDTAYAFKGGEWWDIDAILAQVAGFDARYVTVTGGEPLAQSECLTLLRALCDAGYRVSLETSGALDVSAVDPRVIKVMDLKTPGSGESGKNLYANIDHLGPQDQVKFVIADEADYQWSRTELQRWDLASRCEVLFSPVAGQMSATQLADWILRDRLDVRFQLQLHKLLWGNEPGR